MRPIKRSLFITLPFALLAACATEEGDAEQDGTEDGDSDAILVEGKEDTGGIVESSRDACVVLNVVNTASVAQLDNAPTHRTLPGAGLTKRVAENIVDYRIGDDEEDPSDDQVFDTLVELDDIPKVGPEVFRSLLAFGNARGFTTGCRDRVAIELAGLSIFSERLESYRFDGLGVERIAATIRPANNGTIQPFAGVSTTGEVALIDEQGNAEMHDTRDGLLRWSRPLPSEIIADATQPYQANAFVYDGTLYTVSYATQGETAFRPRISSLTGESFITKDHNFIVDRIMGLDEDRKALVFLGREATDPSTLTKLLWIGIYNIEATFPDRVEIPMANNQFQNLIAVFSTSQTEWLGVLQTGDTMQIWKYDPGEQAFPNMIGSVNGAANILFWDYNNRELNMIGADKKWKLFPMYYGVSRTLGVANIAHSQYVYGVHAGR